MAALEMLILIALLGGSSINGGGASHGLPTESRGTCNPLGTSYDARVARYRVIENEVDRGTGRIVDEQTYFLDHAQMVKTLSDEKLFIQEHDRMLRIDAKQLAERKERKRTEAEQREAAMRLKEYELYVNAGLWDATGAQAEADRIALQQLKERRDADLKSAGKDQSQRAKIEADYQRERARILGFADVPATQPSN